MSAGDSPAELWRRFLVAIEAGDAGALGACLDPAATVFLPLPNTQPGLRGRDAVVARFAKLFAAVGERDGATRPQIDILSFELRELASEVLLGESLLLLGKEWGRRSIVFRRVEGEWRILHVHGSNVPAPVQSQLPVSLG